MTQASGLPQPNGSVSPSRIARRGFALAGLFAAGATIIGGTHWFNIAAEVAGDDLTVTQAYEAARDQRILLVDIRRPDEWAATGIGEGAVPLDMRRDDFIPALLNATSGQRDTPVALICARGVRSRHLSARLRDAGFTQIIDVPEGMLGSGAGPGWLASDLPITNR